MTKNPICIDEESPINEAIKLMEKSGVNHLLVTNEHQKLSGIISQHDILKMSKHLLSQTTGKSYSSLYLVHKPIRELMKTKPICLRFEDDVDYGVEILLQGLFHSLPVIDENERPIGIVTSTDLMKAYYENN